MSEEHEQVERGLEVEILRLRAENERLQAQVDELQAKGTELVMLRRDYDRSTRVNAWHRRFNFPVLHAPSVPSDERMRFRLRLFAEEFFEALEKATVGGWPSEVLLLADARADVFRFIAHAPIRVDLPGFVHELIDVDFVNAGTLAECGVAWRPAWLEVCRANDEKEQGEGGTTKPRKPPGWRAADIAGVLRAQGWKP